MVLRTTLTPITTLYTLLFTDPRHAGLASHPSRRRRSPLSPSGTHTHTPHTLPLAGSSGTKVRSTHTHTQTRKKPFSFSRCHCTVLLRTAPHLQRHYAACPSAPPYPALPGCHWGCQPRTGDVLRYASNVAFPSPLSDLGSRQPKKAKKGDFLDDMGPAAAAAAA